MQQSHIVLLSNYILFCEQLQDVVKKYLNLKIAKDKNDVSFLKGILDIPNDKKEIVQSFLIEIHYCPGFPFRFPFLFEVGEIIPNDVNWHKYEFGMGNCCITVLPDEIINCKNGISVFLFIEKYAIPYFANHIHRIVTGHYKNGEYAHDGKGFSQFYENLFKSDNKDLWIRYFKNTFSNLKVECDRNDKCFCGADKKYKHCHLEIFNSLKLIGEEQVLKDFKLIFSK